MAQGMGTVGTYGEFTVWVISWVKQLLLSLHSLTHLFRGNASVFFVTRPPRLELQLVPTSLTVANRPCI